MQRLDPRDLKPRLTSGEEIAFLDVRETGQYADGHPFFAVNLPYSRLELLAPDLLPRRDVPIVLLHDDDGVAEAAGRRLEGLGYGDLAKVDGGAGGWRGAGFTLFDGVNLPSKAFGEIVEHDLGTPRLTASEFEARRKGGEKFVLLDGRTPREFRKMTIPGSISCPNAELGHRLPALVDDPETTIVINCAGRTRSIIGAQSLRNLGVPNPIYALENGTQGWELAGLTLEHGAERSYPRDLTPEIEARSRQAAADFMQQRNIPGIDPETLSGWRSAEGRTLYLLDVRTEEEFEAGHLPGARHAPGGQLVQATDQWVATRGARIVLCDDTRLRAAGTAYWLRAMGHDAVVLAEDVTTRGDLVAGPAPRTVPEATLPACAMADLAGILASGGALVDLRPGMDFRAGHIAGARWGIRPRLGRIGLRPEQDIVLAGGMGPAELAAVDLREHGCERLHFLPSGLEEWRDAGLEIEATPDSPADAECIDFVFHTHRRHSGDLDAARAYLEWETGLIGRMDEQELGTLRIGG